MDKLANKILTHPLAVLIILSFFGLFLYSIIFYTPFKTLDDYYAIVLNDQIKSFDHAGEILTSSFFGENSYYRPLVYLSFMLEYHFFKLNPFFYNIDNVVIHILSSFGVFLIMTRWPLSRTMAFLVALLFLIHPVQVEAVANIPGRAILLCALFFFYAFYFFLLALAETPKKGWHLVLSLSCYALSLLAKEPAAMLVLVIMSYLILLKNQIKADRKWLITVAGSFVLMTFLYWAGRKLLGITAAFHLPSLSMVILGVFTFLKASFVYLQLLIFPVELYYDRSMPIFQNFSDPQLWLVVLIWVVIITIFLRLRKHISALLIFFLGWIVINMLPVAQIIPVKVSWDRISTADHFLYIASVGFLVIGVVLFQQWSQVLIARKLVSQRWVTWLVIGFCFYLMLTTVQQNIYAKEQTAMFERSLEHNPDNSRVRNALAVAYGYQRLYKEAEKNFRYVLDKEPWDARARIGLGKVLCDQNKCWEGVLEYEKVRDPGGLKDILKNNLDLSYRYLISQYQDRLKREPNNAKLHYSLGVMYGKTNQLIPAIEEYQMAVELDPMNKEALFNLASGLDAFQNKDQALAYYERMIQLTGPKDEVDIQACVRLAEIYQGLGNAEKSGLYAQMARDLTINK